MSKPSRSQNQWILAGLFSVAALGALYGVSQILNARGGVSASSSPSGVTTTMIEERTRAASPEMSWINDATDRLKRMEEQQAALEEQLLATQRKHARERESLQKQSDAVLQRYEDKITALETQLNEKDVQTSMPAGGQGGAPLGSNLREFIQQAAAPLPGLAQTPLGRRPGTVAQGSDPAQAPVPSPAGIVPQAPFTREFTLASQPEHKAPRRKKLGAYLPAGSYAPALVLSGVDAPTTVSSQTDPIPVLFRITGAAVTAGVRSTKGQRINLTGCTVTGSAKGDLSSERVLVRLVKLSCALPNGDVLETNVAGYMSGNGKTGVRGHVVSREGPLVTRAGIAGALGGLADGISSVGQAGANSEQASFEEVLRGAGASSVSGGVGEAASTLSEYYVERAEQYQPVVSLYGGTEVELVFLEGVELNG